MTNHVLIKPLGVMIDPSLIGPSIKFELTEQRTYELISEGADTTASLMVREAQLITASAIVLLRGDFDALAEGQQAYNKRTESELETRIEAELASRRAVVEPPKRRGRKPKVVAPEPDEDGEEDEDAQFDRLFDEQLRFEYKAHSFGIERVVVRSPEEIPFRESAAYVTVCALKSSYKDAIDEKLGQLRRRVNQRAELLSQLQTSGEMPGSALDSVSVATYAGDDLEDDSIRQIDQQALGGQRQTLRNQLTRVEDDIRATHQWLTRNVIEKYQSVAVAKTLPFGDVQMGDSVLLASDVIDSFYSEVLVYRT